MGALAPVEHTPLQQGCFAEKVARVTREGEVLGTSVFTRIFRLPVHFLARHFSTELEKVEQSKV